MRRSLSRRKGSLLFRFCVITLITFIIIVLIDMRIRPTIKAMASYQAKAVVTRSINQAILNELANEKITYSSIITLSNDQEGRVTSVQTNIHTVNQIKGYMTQAAMDAISNIDINQLKIPVGSLLGNEFLSGRGPRINLKILQTGYVEAVMLSKFDSAGINQTQHQILLKIKARVKCILPGYMTSADVDTDFCIAETIIVGTVPQSYTHVIGDDSSTISKINDYSNGAS